MKRSITKEPCIYCGDAPTSHVLHFIHTSVTILFVLPFEFRSSNFFNIQHSPISRRLGHGLVTLLSWAGLVRYSDNIQNVSSARTKVIWQEALRRGIRMQQLILFGKVVEDSRALLPISKGSQRRGWEYFQSIPIPRWLEPNGRVWVDDKTTFKKVFRLHGLPVAEGFCVRSCAEAIQAFKKINAPVIVKPREGSRARHTTVNISDEKELIRAFDLAHQLCPFVIIERHVSGMLHRATCVGGKLVGIMELVKPIVIADGTKTAEELRHQYNATKKFPQLTDVKDNAWYRDALYHQGFTPHSVPPEGTHLILAEHSERSNGGYFVDITDEIPHSTKDAIERAARVCEIMVIGFDILSMNLRDAREPYTFIEGNSLPFIEIHHIPYAGPVRDAAGAVWDRWFESPAAMTN